MFNIPLPVLVTIAGLVAVHLLREFGPDSWDAFALAHFAFVPGRLTFSYAPDRIRDAVVALAQQGGRGYREAQVDRFFLGDGSPEIWTTLTYGLLHAGWLHLGLNGVWLLAFGTPVARRFGPLRFAALFALATWAGAAVHYLVHPFDLRPVIGASAAVSGCMGASLRFVFQPQGLEVAHNETAHQARAEAFRRPALSMHRVLTDRRSLTFIVAWFLTNLLFGVASTSFGAGGGPVAWEAHIGGFVAGLVLFRLFDPVGPSGPDPASFSVPATRDPSDRDA